MSTNHLRKQINDSNRAVNKSLRRRRIKQGGDDLHAFKRCQTNDFTHTSNNNSNLQRQTKMGISPNQSVREVSKDNVILPVVGSRPSCKPFQDTNSASLQVLDSTKFLVDLVNKEFAGASQLSLENIDRGTKQVSFKLENKIIFGDESNQKQLSLSFNTFVANRFVDSEKEKILLKDFMRLKGLEAKDIYVQLLASGLDHKLSNLVFESVIDQQKFDHVCILIITRGVQQHLKTIKNRY